MNTSFKQGITDLGNVIFVCFGRPEESDLPQIGDENAVIIDLMQHLSHKPYDDIRIELHHQFDPSYHKGE